MLNKRQNEILLFLTEVKTAKIEQLSKVFEVSVETIRRDLLELEQQSAVKRIRGGAVFNNYRAKEIEYEKRMGHNHAEKRAIARLAVGYIHDGDALAINNGTSNIELARIIKETHKNLTVITNSPTIAFVLNENETHQIFLPAGNLRRHNKSLVGGICLDSLENFKVDKCILNIDGLSAADGVMEYNTEEAAVARKMLEISLTHMILCEYSRFNEVAFNRVCPANAIDYIFTDWHVTAKEIREWNTVNVKVLSAVQES